MRSQTSEDSPPAILLLVHVYPDGGGIAAIVENLLAMLDQHMNVHVAIVDARPGAVERLGLSPDRVHVLGQVRVANSLLMPGSLIFAIRTSRWLRRVVAQVRPAAILTQDALDLPVPALLGSRGFGVRVAVMDHGTLSNVLDPRWRAMIRARLGGARGSVFALGFGLDTPWRAIRWRLGLRMADAAWYVGQEHTQRFRWARSNARRYAQIVPADFHPPSAVEREAARARFGLAADAVVINLVSRLDPEKNLDNVIDAIETALAVQPRLHVLVAGDGTLRTWLEEELARRVMRDRVHMLGRLPRRSIQSLHHASDFHLYAGVIGCGMSIALLEAMSCGVIPIVSDVPAEQRELVGNAGWVFDANSPDQLQQAIVDAVRTPREHIAELRVAVHDRLARYREPSLQQLVRSLIAS